VSPLDGMPPDLRAALEANARAQAQHYRKLTVEERAEKLKIKARRKAERDRKRDQRRKQRR
jgi:hypothetical protein